MKSLTCRINYGMRLFRQPSGIYKINKINVIIYYPHIFYTLIHVIVDLLYFK